MRLECETTRSCCSNSSKFIRSKQGENISCYRGSQLRSLTGQHLPFPAKLSSTPGQRKSHPSAHPQYSSPTLILPRAHAIELSKSEIASNGTIDNSGLVTCQSLTHPFLPPLSHVNVPSSSNSSSDYTVIFTQNATGALKLVGEQMDWTRGVKTFRYSSNCHTSIVGIRASVEAQGGAWECFDALDDKQKEYGGDGGCDDADVSLYAFPAQCNSTGVRVDCSRYIQQVSIVILITWRNSQSSLSPFK